MRGDAAQDHVAHRQPRVVKSATGTLEASFQDVAQGCPDAAGKRRGKVKATGRAHVKVERDGKPPVEMELAADVEMGYTATSGEDGKVATIDDVDVRTEFRSASLVGIGPMSFDLPPEGGSQRISGGVQDGGDGFFKEGKLTVVRTR